MAILWSDIFIHDLISQIEHFCYWNFSANFVRQYYKMIWANFCWQLYIMGKIDIMKGVSESFTVLQGIKIHEKGNWKISEFLFLCEVRLREHPLLEHWNCHKKIDRFLSNLISDDFPITNRDFKAFHSLIASGFRIFESLDGCIGTSRVPIWIFPKRKDLILYNST